MQESKGNVYHLANRKLSTFFQFEVRVVWAAVIVGVLLSLAYPDDRDAGNYVIVAVVALVLVSDGIISILLTYIFLCPILDTLNMAQGIIRSSSHRELEVCRLSRFRVSTSYFYVLIAICL